MHISIGSDDKTALTDSVINYLKLKKYTYELVGPLNNEALAWPMVAEKVALNVIAHKSQYGILFCWTGTGVCMAANKLPGVRAALCPDVATASGARKWNDANILVLSLRYTSLPLAEEILQAWFHTEPDPSELTNINYLHTLEKKYK